MEHNTSKCTALSIIRKPSYKRAIGFMLKGIVMIFHLLPGTFKSSWRDMFVKHPIIVVLFLGLIIYQFKTYVRLQAGCDSRDMQIIKLEHQIDSITGKQIKYTGWNAWKEETKRKSISAGI